MPFRKPPNSFMKLYPGGGFMPIMIPDKMRASEWVDDVTGAVGDGERQKAPWTAPLVRVRKPTPKMEGALTAHGQDHQGLWCW
jgi:hypothetical protein